MIRFISFTHCPAISSTYLLMTSTPVYQTNTDFLKLSLCRAFSFPTLSLTAEDVLGLSRPCWKQSMLASPVHNASVGLRLRRFKRVCIDSIIALHPKLISKLLSVTYYTMLSATRHRRMRFVLIPEDGRLSWPGWLVICRDALPVQRQSLGPA